jgi:hypothetical protein
MQVAETFTFQLNDHDDDKAADGRGVSDQQPADGTACKVGPSLNDVARLDTCVTVVDAAAFFANVESIEDLRDRWGGWGGWPCRALPTGPRTSLISRAGRGVGRPQLAS